MSNRKRLEEARGTWEKEVLAPALEGRGERKEAFVTASNIPLERLYDFLEEPEDRDETVGFPGSYPFTRGAYPAMYRQDFWIFGQYSGSGSAEETNARFRHLLAQGQTGFSVALDLPTQNGYDPDAPISLGEVGKVGVSLASLKDMERLFEGIPFDKVRQIRTTANAMGPVFVAMVVAMAKRQGADPRGIKLFVQNDVLKEYIARGTQIYPPASSLRHTIDVVEYCAREGLTSWTPLAISGYHIRDSGATAVQELAFSFANAIAYFDEAVRRGMGINDFAPNIWAFFASDIQLLEEVAKFRAARRVWAKLMRERYGADDPQAMALKIFGFTLGGRLVAQQPLNNVVRVTLMALAAALGGVNTLHTTAFDEAFATPTEAAATLALRTQQIIAHETGVADVIDGIGGSWTVEHLTNEIERQVWQSMEEIEERGGALDCIEQGWFQRTLADQAYRCQKEVESEERVVVGVNRFTSSEEAEIPVFEVDPGTQEHIVARIENLKALRDPQRVSDALSHVEMAARRGENTVYSIVNAVEADCTVGDICGVLRNIWGTYEEVPIL